MVTWLIFAVMCGILCTCAQTSLLQEKRNVFNSIYQHTSRNPRSGGYPKFPLHSSPTCGNRSVAHFPAKAGQPLAKIVGGSMAPYGAYPWQVELKQYRSAHKRWEHHCGGAVVGSQLVLTAAHCLESAEAAPDQLRVVVGEYHLHTKDTHEQSFKVESFAVHPEFRKVGPYSNDIGLIKVKSIAFNSHVQPICLPQLQSKSNAGSWCVVSGWGAQKADDVDSLSAVLQVAAVPLLDLDTCRKDEVYGGRRQSILDSMICAGALEGGVDACGGDSGGPLACDIDGRFVLIGLVSWGDGCAKRNRPGVYTRVSYFVDWIEIMKKRLGLR